jgi:predicted CXXCH cytochrome family protein
MIRRWLTPLLAVAALGMVLGGCMDERIVYKDRDLFSEPATGAAGFLGYSNADSKLTTCGSCHKEHQANWIGTGHAGAFASLKSSSHAQTMCEGCHSVSGEGNIVDGPAGFVATGEARYKDVQCESCHGPGLDHVRNPSKLTTAGVLAPMGNRQGDAWVGCAQCHQGAHHPQAEEWYASAHGNGVAWRTTSAGGREACVECHTAENALIKFGVNANYIEKATHLNAHTTELNMSITCAVCHDPHGAKHAGQLRKSITEPDMTKNLCMKCHYKRGTPDPTTFRGPHAPEAQLLIGNAGWWSDLMHARFPEGAVYATHGAPEANPKLCVSCHMGKADYSQDGRAIHGSGHFFEATPCLDDDGKPIVKGTCAKAAPTRAYTTCTGAGCHANAEVTRSAISVVDLRIERLVQELDRNLQEINANWRTCRNNNSCAPVNGSPSPFNFVAGSYNTALGAAFNYDMGARRSAAMHNPMLVEALLITSIQAVRRDYGITSALQVNLAPALTQ